jgi:hypothetical protein
MPRAHASLVAAVVLSCFGVSSRARADEKQACITAFEDAQQLRIDGKLLAARTRLLECARPECPALVRQDCTQWMADVVAATPTVVLGARDRQGQDVIDVKAEMDGAPVAARLDGRPIPVDPGVHVFRFESTVAAGMSAQAQVLVRAGEKNREITVTFGGPASTSTSKTPEAARPEGQDRANVPALSWVFGGVALASLGTALAFDVAQAVDYDHLSSTCAGHCSPGDVDHVATERWIAGITAGVGAVSLAVAAYFFFARPSNTGSAGAAPVALDFAPLPRGGMGAIVGRF